MLAFWFALHAEKLEMCQMIFEIDPIIDKILNVIRVTGTEELIIKKGRELEKKKRDKNRKSVKESGDQDSSDEEEE